MRQSLTSLPALSLYDGQTLIGTISIVKERFVARDAARRLLGRFKSQKAALAATTVRLPVTAPAKRMLAGTASDERYAAEAQ
jgi:hypothetical protein